MPANRRLQHISCKSPVAEHRTTRGHSKDGGKAFHACIVEVIVRRFGHLFQDAHQFLVGVVGEFDSGTKTARQTWILGNEDRHWNGIACNDEDQVVATVLHLFDQRIDRLLAVLITGEAVCLVDEEDSASCGCHDLRRLDCRLAEITGD
jgi:hypothetical protein